jgi:hypothetical protein
MRRLIIIVIAGASLGGCSSFSLDAFKPTPPNVQVQLESVPPGADARTSLGPGCKTPCSVDIPAPDTGFSVSYTLDKYQPATVSVQVMHKPGDFGEFFTPSTSTLDPNPVVAELQPVPPPPKPKRKKLPKPKGPRNSAAAAPSASPFPEPVPAFPPPPAR